MRKPASPRSTHVLDARGKSAKVLDPYLLYRLHRYDVIPAEPLASIAHDIGSGWAQTGRIIFSFVWPTVFVCMLIAHFRKWGGGFGVASRELSLWLVLLGIFVVNITLVWVFSRLGRLPRVCRIMLAHMRCPHCGYDLRGLPIDSSDGATVCPECGCAWKLESTVA